MAIISLSIVKNEEDIIETMVRHNSQYLSHMHIIDNGSTDRTAEILHSLMHEGLPITLSHDHSMGHMQESILNAHFAKVAADLGDMVFFLDGDEFIVAKDREWLEAQLGSETGVLALPWVTYVPCVDDPQDILNPLMRIPNRRKREVPQFYKVIVPSGQGLQVASGNHSVHGKDHTVLPDAYLAHFPVRSAHQIAAKVLLGSWSITKRGREGSEAYQWFDLAEDIRQSGFPDAEKLQKIANSYAARREVALRHAPVQSPNPFELRYTYDAQNAAFSSIVGFVDALLAEMAARDPNDGDDGV